MKETINDEIVSIAREYLGEKELKGNSGFHDEEFERRMDAVGWKLGQAWCAYFSELVWKQAYNLWDATLFTRLDKLFSASAVETFKNFSKTKDFIVSNKPIKGALMVWRNYKNGKPHWTGHVGIVELVDHKNKRVVTIEGNSNSDGGREGIEVANQMRSIEIKEIQNGLVLLGFVWPKEIE